MAKFMKLVLMLVAAWLVWKYIVSNLIEFDYSLPFFGAGSLGHVDEFLDYGPYSKYKLGSCEPAFSSEKECHAMAASMCGVTDDKLNGCWLPAYSKCLASAPNDLVRANCHKYANAYCGNIPGDCAECFGKAHNMCMAKKGLASPLQCTY